jgi:hypothetical protein
MITWTKGGTATVETFSEPWITVRSTTSAAPGTPLQGRVGELLIIVKIKSCKKTGDAFTIEGRLVNLTKELRAALGAAREALTPGPSPRTGEGS